MLYRKELELIQRLKYMIQLSIIILLVQRELKGLNKKNKDAQDALKKSQSESENDSTTKSSSDDSDD